MIDEILNQINHYLYPEYVVAVIIITALVRWLFKGIDIAIHPKWITLFVGVVLAILGFAWKTFAQEEYKIFKVLISFGVSTLGYDYFWKVIKDKLTQPKS